MKRIWDFGKIFKEFLGFENFKREFLALRSLLKIISDLLNFLEIRFLENGYTTVLSCSLPPVKKNSQQKLEIQFAIVLRRLTGKISQ